ncbi:MAG: hypothetical protein Q8Q03_03100 [bacterium]|nr:hypothetical protein [bacterium]
MNKATAGKIGKVMEKIEEDIEAALTIKINRMYTPINCCRNWGKVPANNRLCRYLNVDGCLDMECTWNLERNPGHCLYEGRSIRNNNNGMRRIYLISGPVEAGCELDAIVLCCPTCDVNKVCSLLPGVVARSKGVVV